MVNEVAQLRESIENQQIQLNKQQELIAEMNTTDTGPQAYPLVSGQQNNGDIAHNGSNKTLVAMCVLSVVLGIVSTVLLIWVVKLKSRPKYAIPHQAQDHDPNPGFVSSEKGSETESLTGDNTHHPMGSFGKEFNSNMKQESVV